MVCFTMLFAAMCYKRAYTNANISFHLFLCVASFCFISHALCLSISLCMWISKTENSCKNVSNHSFSIGFVFFLFVVTNRMQHRTHTHAFNYKKCFSLPVITKVYPFRR